MSRYIDALVRRKPMVTPAITPVHPGTETVRLRFEQVEPEMKKLEKLNLSDEELRRQASEIVINAMPENASKNNEIEVLQADLVD